MLLFDGTFRDSHMSSDAAPPATKRQKKRDLASPVWEHCSRVEDKDSGETYAQCNSCKECNVVYKAKVEGGSTSLRLRDLKAKHPNLVRVAICVVFFAISITVFTCS